MRSIKICLSLVFNFTLFFANAQQPSYDTIQYAREYHRQRLTFFSREPITKGNTIFLGNSITEFGNWKKLLADSSVVNRGIAGDNTFGVLARLNDVIVRQPGKIFLEVGINDLSQNIPVNVVVKNILTIVEKVRAGSPHTKIYIISILPTNDNVKNEYPDAFNKNNQVSIVNTELEKSALKSQYTYIALNEKLKDRGGKLDTKFAQPDGLHLNEKGYQIWVDLLKTRRYL